MTRCLSLLVFLVLLNEISLFKLETAHAQEEVPAFKEPRLEKPSIEEFLAAEDLSRFFGRFDDHLEELIQGHLKEGDLETPKRVFEHYVKLWKDAREKGDQRGLNIGDASDAGQFLRKINGHSSNARSRFAFTLEVLRDPIRGIQVDVMENAIPNLVSPMVQKYHRDSGNVPGEDRRLKAFEEYFQFLSSAIGGRLCSIAGPGFSELFVNLGDREIEQIIEWLETKGFGPLAKELAMAARLRMELQGEVDPPSGISEAQRYYLFVLNDQSLPVSWRLETARSLAELLGKRLHVDLVMKVGELLVNGWDTSGVVVRWMQADTLLKAYLGMSDKGNPEWIRRGRLITDAWLRARNDRKPPMSPQPLQSEVMQIMKLALATKNDEVLTEMVFNDFVGETPTGEGLLMLIGAGKVDLAKRVLEER